MTNVMRYRYGEENPRLFAVDSSTVIEIGDLLWLDTDDVKPASDLTWNTDLATTQADFASKIGLCCGQISVPCQITGWFDIIGIQPKKITDLYYRRAIHCKEPRIFFSIAISHYICH